MVCLFLITDVVFFYFYYLCCCCVSAVQHWLCFIPEKIKLVRVAPLYLQARLLPFGWGVAEWHRLPFFFFWWSAMQPNQNFSIGNALPKTIRGHVKWWKESEKRGAFGASRNKEKICVKRAEWVLWLDRELTEHYEFVVFEWDNDLKKCQEPLLLLNEMSEKIKIVKKRAT